MKSVSKTILSLIMLLMILAMPVQATDLFDDEAYPFMPATQVHKKTVRILMIGNSLTYFHKSPEILKKMCASQGISVHIDTLMARGHSLSRYAGIVQRHKNDDLFAEQLFIKLTNEEWDYVVLQPKGQEDMRSESLLYQSFDTLIPMIRDAGAEPVLNCIWARNYQNRNYSYEERQAHILSTYSKMASTYHFALAPSGLAFYRQKTLYPNWSLYIKPSDRRHPSCSGSYLSAACLYGTIFQRDPQKITYTAGLSSSVAKKLLAIAADVTTASGTYNTPAHASAPGYRLEKGKKMTLPYKASGLRAISWTSSNEDVATVSEKGEVTAKGHGNAVIKLLFNNNSCLTWDILVFPSSLSLGVDDSYTFSTDRKNGKWSVSDPSVLELKKGRIHVLTPGDAAICFTGQDGFSVDIPVTLQETRTRITMADPPKYLRVGRKYNLTPDTKPNQTKFHSSNPAIISVNQKGVMTAIAPGRATITIKSQGLKTSFTVNSVIQASSLKFKQDKKRLELSLGKKCQITPIFSPTNVSVKKLRWISECPEIATVTKNGLVKAVGGGVTRITAMTTDGSNLKQSFQVKVSR